MRYVDGLIGRQTGIKTIQPSFYMLNYLTDEIRLKILADPILHSKIIFVTDSLNKILTFDGTFNMNFIKLIDHVDPENICFLASNSVITRIETVIGLGCHFTGMDKINTAESLFSEMTILYYSLRIDF